MKYIYSEVELVKKLDYSLNSDYLAIRILYKTVILFSYSEFFS